ncbi:hypothetical protein [Neisseria gonorrhoeae]|uniref:hypothetical protein n=1 Tax=Neisseria gonorrhoeae TaxID=485 RepID=UPI0037CC54E8
MNTKTELQKLLEEDISTLKETLIRVDALPPRYVRSIATPIVRRWLIDKQLNILAKEIGLTIELPILDTSLVFEKLSTLENKDNFYSRLTKIRTRRRAADSTNSTARRGNAVPV